ncbi:MAG: NUDIX hydrolase [Proteobacteria bacterium]|nr:NUDIX hydrolase [Pseudomonadota bacterium]
MDETIWKPHTTVAAMCERDGHFLLVKEKVNGKVVFNQPAGHLNPDESLLDAVIRETFEETQYEFNPTGLQGIYHFVPEEAPETTYIRFLFCGDAGSQLNGALDEGIISAEWMNYDEIRSCREQHRSPLVLQGIDDYLSKPPYPLDVISQIFPDR